jgi:hypothetical protein
MLTWAPATGPAAETACGSKELNHPLSRFPLRGKAGAGGFPPRRDTCPASKKRWHAPCGGSPHKRATAPLCIPRELRIEISTLLKAIQARYNYGLSWLRSHWPVLG